MMFYKRWWRLRRLIKLNTTHINVALCIFAVFDKEL